MKTAQHTPDVPEVPQPRLPFDPERLHKLELASDAAYAVTRQLHDRLDKLRQERGKLKVAIDNDERPQGKNTYTPGASAPGNYAHLEFVEDQIRAVEAEMKAHHAKTAPLRALAQSCVEWARRHRWRGNNAIGIPGAPATHPHPHEVGLDARGAMPTAHQGPPPSASYGAGLMAKAAGFAARLTGGPHGR